MKPRPSDKRYMAMALGLAAKGLGWTSPNPAVGAVVVRQGKVVGRGSHQRAGGPHAEVLALRQAGTRAAGGTLYLTLEPCCHTAKRTPPCVPLIVASGLTRVVVAQLDPNPRVAGRGMRALRRAGIETSVGESAAQAAALIEGYATWIRRRRPFVIMKAGMTLDGKIATVRGESRWVTGPAARRIVHDLRARMDAVLVGIGTILKDDPRLTARPAGKRARGSIRQPLRVILDSRLRTPPTAKVVRGIRQAPTIIMTTSRASRRKIERFRQKGIAVAVLPSDHGRVSFRACLRHLGRLGIVSVLVEGGSEVFASAIRSGLVDRVQLHIAPLLLGGQDARGLLGGSCPPTLASATRLHFLRVSWIGRDLLVEAVPNS